MLSPLQRIQIIAASMQAGLGMGNDVFLRANYEPPEVSPYLPSYRDRSPSPNRMSQAKRRKRAKWASK